MAKSKYKFNPETLSYDKVDNSIKRKIIRFLPFLVSVTFLSLIFHFLVFPSFMDSPKEKRLKQENAKMEAYMATMKDRLDNLEKIIDDIAKRDDNVYRSVFNQDPIPTNLRNPGVGGTNKYEKFEGLKNSELIINIKKKLDRLERKVVVQSKSFDELSELAKKREEMLNCIPAIIPVSQKEMRKISSFFGPRRHPILGYVRMHSGIDITAPRGASVYSSGDGKVVEAGWTKGGYGRKVVVDHGFGYKTVYAHLHRIKVKKGQVVKRGEIIGLVGSTGLSVSPHLHYEVRLKNKPIDPINFFFNDMTPEEYDVILQEAARSN